MAELTPDKKLINFVVELNKNISQLKSMDGIVEEYIRYEKEANSDIVMPNILFEEPTDDVFDRRHDTREIIKNIKEQLSRLSVLYDSIMTDPSILHLLDEEKYKILKGNIEKNKHEYDTLFVKYFPLSLERTVTDELRLVGGSRNNIYEQKYKMYKSKCLKLKNK